MHMMCHLLECVLDFGPLHEFWLFPFERFNGVLGGIPNNNKSIEVQVMKRYLNNQCVSTVSKPQEFKDEFMEFLDESNEQVGSLGTTFRASFKWPPISSLQVPFNWSLDVIKHAVWLPKHYVRGIFDSSELLLLDQLYTHLYSVGSSDIEIPSSFFKYTSIRIFTNVLEAYKSRSSSSCVVMALWDSTFFINSHDNLASEKKFRPARINFFVKHTVSIKGKFTICTCLFHSHGTNIILYKIIMINHYLYGNVTYSKCLGSIVMYQYNSYLVALPLLLTNSVNLILLFCLLYRLLTSNCIIICISTHTLTH